MRGSCEIVIQYLMSTEGKILRAIALSALFFMVDNVGAKPRRHPPPHSSPASRAGDLDPSVPRRPLPERPVFRDSPRPMPGQPHGAPSRPNLPPPQQGFEKDLPKPATTDTGEKCDCGLDEDGECNSCLPSHP